MTKKWGDPEVMLNIAALVLPLVISGFTTVDKERQNYSRSLRKDPSLSRGDRKRKAKEFETTLRLWHRNSQKDSET